MLKEIYDLLTKRSVYLWHKSLSNKKGCHEFLRDSPFLYKAKTYSANLPTEPNTFSILYLY